jgi:hypothetical protein
MIDCEIVYALSQRALAISVAAFLAKRDNVQRGATVRDSKLLQLRRIAAIRVKNCRFKSRKGFALSLRCLFVFGYDNHSMCCPPICSEPVELFKTRQ